MGVDSDLFKIREQMEWVKSDMAGLTALIHMTLEGIRVDCVGIDEVQNAVASLLNLSESITGKIEDINEKLAR